VLTADLAARELVGADALISFGHHLYRDRDPVARLFDGEPFRVDAVGDSLVLSMYLPFTEKADVELGRADGELLLAVGSHRRALVLPDSLRRREVVGARMSGDRLEVEFVAADA
jgi:arsenite-transporting ATPase